MLPQALHSKEDGKIGEEDEEDEGKDEGVKVMEEQAEFDEIMVWGHEVVVDAAEDCYARGVEEWIDFAESVSLLYTSI